MDRLNNKHPYLDFGSYKSIGPNKYLSIKRDLYNIKTQL